MTTLAATPSPRSVEDLVHSHLPLVGHLVRLDLTTHLGMPITHTA
jgi:hypothetical protein